MGCETLLCLSYLDGHNVCSLSGGNENSSIRVEKRRPSTIHRFERLIYGLISRSIPMLQLYQSSCSLSCSFSLNVGSDDAWVEPCVNEQAFRQSCPVVRFTRPSAYQTTEGGILYVNHQCHVGFLYLPLYKT